MPFSISPTVPTLISPSQVQALISQFHSPFTPQTPVHVNLPLTTNIGSSRGSPAHSRNAIRVLRSTKDTADGGSNSLLTSVPPLSVQTMTVASDQSQQIITNSSQTASDSPQRETDAHDRGQSLQQTQLHFPAGNFVLNPSQAQALVNQIQAQQRIGEGQNVLFGSQPQFQLLSLPGFTAMTTGSETD